jgi:NADPH:quinone reductase-like Zn-dependent oxidoreductase
MNEHEAVEGADDQAATPLPTLPATMRAVVQDTYGSHEALRLRTVAVPAPAEDEVLIKVVAASLNAADWHYMMGEPYLARLVLGVGRPGETIQGRDVAGRVEAVGAAVSTFRPGDEVFGRPGAGPLSGGAFAEYTCARAAHVVRKPAAVTFEQAAAVPLAANTALQALRDLGEVAPGQKVLVNGASGGVGTFAVQIAKALGAEVTGVCSTRNMELVGSLGADHVIDYTRQDFTRLGKRYDVVIDMVPHGSITAVRRAMTRDGTLVMGGGKGGRWVGPMLMPLRAKAMSPFVSQRLLWHNEAPSPRNLELLAEWIASGKITPAIERVHPLAEVPEAMRYLVEEHARAKVVIVT